MSPRTRNALDALERWGKLLAGIVVAIFVAGVTWSTLNTRVSAVERKTDELTEQRKTDAEWRRRVEKSLDLIICKLDPGHCTPTAP